MDTRVPPSGLNPSLLALLVDLRYSISIFARRLMVTENISGRAVAPFAPPPGYAPGSNEYFQLTNAEEKLWKKLT